MTTQAEYDAGIAAAIKLMQADIVLEVPEIFRSRITPAAVNSHAHAIAKVVIDAAAAARKQNEGL